MCLPCAFSSLPQGDPRWYIADPICTFVFAIIVLLTTVSIVRDILRTLMESAPNSVDMEQLLSSMHQVGAGQGKSRGETMR